MCFSALHGDGYTTFSLYGNSSRALCYWLSRKRTHPSCSKGKQNSAYHQPIEKYTSLTNKHRLRQSSGDSRYHAPGETSGSQILQDTMVGIRNIARKFVAIAVESIVKLILLAIELMVFDQMAILLDLWWVLLAPSKHILVLTSWIGLHYCWRLYT